MCFFRSVSDFPRTYSTSGRKPQNSMDHSLPWVWSRKRGSKRKGKVSNPSNEPTLETEYSLYVPAPPPRRATTAAATVRCERTKKGKPAATTMMAITSRVGSPPGCGFQDAPGVIARATARTAPARSGMHRQQHKVNPSLPNRREPNRNHMRINVSRSNKA